MGAGAVNDPRPIFLDDRTRLTLADAIDAYRSVRTEDHEWMRLDYFDRFSPAELDDLRRSLLEGTE